MEQVQFFIDWHTRVSGNGALFTSSVNKWLEEHPKIKVVERQMTTCPCDSGVMIVIAIHYTTS